MSLVELGAALDDPDDPNQPRHRRHRAKSRPSASDLPAYGGAADVSYTVDDEDIMPAGAWLQ